MKFSLCSRKQTNGRTHRFAEGPATPRSPYHSRRSRSPRATWRVDIARSSVAPSRSAMFSEWLTWASAIPSRLCRVAPRTVASEPDSIAGSRALERKGEEREIRQFLIHGRFFRNFSRFGDFRFAPRADNRIGQSFPKVVASKNNGLAAPVNSPRNERFAGSEAWVNTVENVEFWRKPRAPGSDGGKHLCIIQQLRFRRFHRRFSRARRSYLANGNAAYTRLAACLPSVPR